MTPFHSCSGPAKQDFKNFDQIYLLNLYLVFEKSNIRGHVRAQPRETESVLGWLRQGLVLLTYPASDFSGHVFIR